MDFNETINKLRDACESGNDEVILNLTQDLISRDDSSDAFTSCDFAVAIVASGNIRSVLLVLEQVREKPSLLIRYGDILRVNTQKLLIAAGSSGSGMVGLVMTELLLSRPSVVGPRKFTNEILGPRGETLHALIEKRSRGIHAVLHWLILLCGPSIDPWVKATLEYDDFSLFRHAAQTGSFYRCIRLISYWIRIKWKPLLMNPMNDAFPRWSPVMKGEVHNSMLINRVEKNPWVERTKEVSRLTARIAASFREKKLEFPVRYLFRLLESNNYAVLKELTSSPKSRNGNLYKMVRTVYRKEKPEESRKWFPDE